MSSKIEQLIDDLEEYIDSCKPKFMSNTDIIVNRDEVDDSLRELRASTPDEIKRYQKIINNKEAILNDAREKAQALIDQATAQTNELISEHEIMQQAYAQANEVVTTAAAQAQEILDKATTEANELRMQATAYIDERLAEIEAVLASAIQNHSAQYEVLISSLQEYNELISANREALHPEEETYEHVPMEEVVEENIDLDLL